MRLNFPPTILVTLINIGCAFAEPEVLGNEDKGQLGAIRPGNWMSFGRTITHPMREVNHIAPIPAELVARHQAGRGSQGAVPSA